MMQRPQKYDEEEQLDHMALSSPLPLQFTTPFILRATLTLGFLRRPERATGPSPRQEHVLRTAGQQSHSTPVERLPKTPVKGGPSSRFYSLGGTEAAIQPPTRLAGALLIASPHDEWRRGTQGAASSQAFRTERVPVGTPGHSCSRSANMLV